MARNLSTDYQNALDADVINLGLLVDLEWANNTSYFWTGYGDLVYDGNTYLGVGDLGRISPIRESTNIQADGVEIEFVGIPTTLLSLVLQEARQGKTVAIHQGVFNDDWSLIEVAPNVFKGKLDVPVINKSTKNAKITVKAESDLIGLGRASNKRRYTDQDQQEIFPGDKSFRFVAELQDREIRWGMEEGD